MLLMKYFVLKPSGDSIHAVASREAMFRYAEVIEQDDPVLAAELCSWVEREVHSE